VPGGAALAVRAPAPDPQHADRKSDNLLERYFGEGMRGDIVKQLAVDPGSTWHDPDLAKLAA
jgi:hypothetical protein